MEKISNSFKKFLEGLKQERKETKEAYRLLVDSVKNKKKLMKNSEKILFFRKNFLKFSTSIFIFNVISITFAFLLLNHFNIEKILI